MPAESKSNQQILEFKKAALLHPILILAGALSLSLYLIILDYNDSDFEQHASSLFSKVLAVM